MAYRLNRRCKCYIFNLDQLMWLFDSRHVECYSPLPPQECSERLLGFSLPAVFGSKPLKGIVSNRSLQIRKRILGQNSFQPVLFAAMQPERQCTRIRGKFGLLTSRDEIFVIEQVLIEKLESNGPGTHVA